MAAPGIGTAFAVLYPSHGSGFNGIALQNAAGSFDITGRNPSVPALPGGVAEMETCLPGKVLMKTGLVTNNLAGGGTGVGNVPVVFATAFPTDIRSVQVTPRKADGAFIVSGTITFGVTNVSATGFNFTYINTTGQNFQGFYWTAIGTSI